jgi:hypothetical protein
MAAIELFAVTLNTEPEAIATAINIRTSFVKRIAANRKID